jgi:hypothetical protein
MYIIVTILEFEDTGEGPKSAMPIYYKLKEYACQRALFG